jgi:hypothetical protein
MMVWFYVGWLISGGVVWSYTASLDECMTRATALPPPTIWIQACVTGPKLLALLEEP